MIASRAYFQHFGRSSPVSSPWWATCAPPSYFSAPSWPCACAGNAALLRPPWPARAAGRRPPTVGQQPHRAPKHRSAMLVPPVPAPSPKSLPVASSRRSKRHPCCCPYGRWGRWPCRPHMAATPCAPYRVRVAKPRVLLFIFTLFSFQKT
jgi:hypothetical protein